MRCPKCNKNVYSHHQEINKSRTEVKRTYYCKKCECLFYTIEHIVEEQKPSKIIIWSCNEYIAKTRRKLNIKEDDVYVMRRVTCNDGFSVSIQASADHYCHPRMTFEGPYTEVELGYPNCSEELLMPYIEDGCCEPEDAVYPYMPVEVVDKVIKKHGGIVYDIGIS